MSRQQHALRTHCRLPLVKIRSIGKLQTPFVISMCTRASAALSYLAADAAESFNNFNG